MQFSSETGGFAMSPLVRDKRSSGGGGGADAFPRFGGFGKQQQPQASSGSGMSVDSISRPVFGELQTANFEFKPAAAEKRRGGGGGGVNSSLTAGTGLFGATAAAAAAAGSKPSGVFGAAAAAKQQQQQQHQPPLMFGAGAAASRTALGAAGNRNSISSSGVFGKPSAAPSMFASRLQEALADDNATTNDDDDDGYASENVAAAPAPRPAAQRYHHHQQQQTQQPSQRYQQEQQRHRQQQQQQHQPQHQQPAAAGSGMGRISLRAAATVAPTAPVAAMAEPEPMTPASGVMGESFPGGGAAAAARFGGGGQRKASAGGGSSENVSAGSFRRGSDADAAAAAAADAGAGGRGGGPVIVWADVLSWREPLQTLTVFAAGALLMFLVWWTLYGAHRMTLVSTASYLLLADLGLNFTRYFVSEPWHKRCLWGGAAQMKRLLTRVNAAVLTLGELHDAYLSSVDPAVTLRVACALWACAWYGAYLDLKRGIVVAYVGAFTAPLLYKFVAHDVQLLRRRVAAATIDKLDAAGLPRTVRFVGGALAIAAMAVVLPWTQALIGTFVVATYWRTLLAPREIELIRTAAEPYTQSVRKVGRRLSVAAEDAFARMSTARPATRTRPVFRNRRD